VVSTPLSNISQNGNLPQIGVKIKKIFETTTQYMYIYILSVKHLVYLVDLSSFFPPGSHFTHSTPNPKAAPHLDGWAAHQSIVAGF